MTVQNAVGRRELGTAVSATQFFRELGGSLGTAIFGAVFAARLSFWRPRLLPGLASGTLRQGRAAALYLDPASVDRLGVTAPALHHDVTRMLTLSLHVVFLTAFPFAVAAFLATWLLPRRRLQGDGWHQQPAAESEAASAAPAAEGS
jgi:hypothetical protein